MNFKICLIYTGVSRNLVDTLYNVRVDECKKAANIMNTFKQNSQLEFSDLFLRNFTINDFEKVKSFLPLNLEKRCLHFYGEMNRVKAGVSYFRNGNISKFGQLIFASGNSSIKNYETGSKILETLHSILLNADGVYGGRFSGAGFNGYYMALVDPKKEESLKKYVTDTYLKIYPEYEGKFKIVFCNTSDGVKL